MEIINYTYLFLLGALSLLLGFYALSSYREDVTASFLDKIKQKEFYKRTTFFLSVFIAQQLVALGGAIVYGLNYQPSLTYYCFHMSMLGIASLFLSVILGLAFGIHKNTVRKPEDLSSDTHVEDDGVSADDAQSVSPEDSEALKTAEALAVSAYHHDIEDAADSLPAEKESRL